MQHKIHALLVALLTSVAFVGCTSDDDVADDGAMKQLSFSAIVDGGNVRAHAADRLKTQLQHDNSVTFCEDDAISVFDATTLRNRCFATLESGATVTFSGVAPESTTYTALYPYQEDAKISGQTITAVLPTTQYAQSDLTFDPQAVLSVATTTKAEMTFAFKNVCSLLKFTTTEPLAKVVFKGNNQEKVAGNVSITVSAEPTATGTAESITLLPAEGASIPTGTYYIAVLPQKFEKGFTLEAYKNGSTEPDYVLYIEKEVLVERACVHNVGKWEAPDTFNDHDYVDLGIVFNGRKVLWATMNVGANAPEEYGDYFAWGETKPKSNYTWTSYKWCEGTGNTLTKYNRDSSKGQVDNKTKLELTDDAARQNWGGYWVMPTRAELLELYDEKNCTREWTTLNGINGWKFTSKHNGNSIFLPAAGYNDGTSIKFEGERGYFWSSSLRTDNPVGALYLFFFSGDAVDLGSYFRYSGYSVRPVIRVAQ